MSAPSNQFHVPMKREKATIKHRKLRISPSRRPGGLARSVPKLSTSISTTMSRSSHPVNLQVHHRQVICFSLSCNTSICDGIIFCTFNLLFSASVGRFATYTLVCMLDSGGGIFLDSSSSLTLQLNPNKASKSNRQHKEVICIHV